MKDTPNRPATGNPLLVVVFGSLCAICAATGAGVTSGALRVVLVALAVGLAALAGGGLRVMLAGHGPGPRAAGRQGSGAGTSEPRRDGVAKR